MLDDSSHSFVALLISILFIEKCAVFWVNSAQFIPRYNSASKQYISYIMLKKVIGSKQIGLPLLPAIHQQWHVDNIYN